jgi:hypothetical protein
MRKETAQTSEGPTVPGDLRLKPTGQTGEARVLFKASARARGL